MMQKIKMIKKSSALLSLALSMLLGNTSAAATVERIVATVDGTAITSFELDQAVKTRGPQLQKTEKVYGATLRAKTLDLLIDDKVLENALKKSDITVPPHEIDSFVDRILTTNRMSMEQFEQGLTKEGLTIQKYRNQLEEQIRRNKFVSNNIGRKINISERELRSYFEKHLGDFKSISSIQLEQIVIVFPEDTSEANIKRVEKLAITLAKEASSASSLEALAKKHSTHSLPVHGGNLGIVSIKDLQPQVAEAARVLSVGQASGPIVTQAGIVIIKVTGRGKTSVKDFPDLREDVYNVLYEDKMQSAVKGYIKQLRKTAQITIKGLN